MYWLLYLPTSLILYSRSPQDSLIGILLAGLGVSLLFSLVLAPTKGFLFPKKKIRILVPNGFAKTSGKRKRGRPKKVVEKSTRKIASKEVKNEKPKIRTDVDIKHLNLTDDYHFS